jgi:hypothetical protein
VRADGASGCCATKRRTLIRVYAPRRGSLCAPHKVYAGIGRCGLYAALSESLLVTAPACPRATRRRCTASPRRSAATAQPIPGQTTNPHAAAPRFTSRPQPSPPWSAGAGSNYQPSRGSAAIFHLSPTAQPTLVRWRRVKVPSNDRARLQARGPASLWVRCQYDNVRAGRLGAQTRPGELGRLSSRGPAGSVVCGYAVNMHRSHTLET